MLTPEPRSWHDPGTTEVNATTYAPLAFAGSTNSRTLASFFAHDALTISKLLKTRVPLMLTLKTRDPAVEKKVSAKCSRTSWLEAAPKPGIV